MTSQAEVDDRDEVVVHESRLLKALDVAIVVAALATIPVIVMQIQGRGGAWVIAADWVIWAVFLLDYLAMLGESPREGGFISRNPLDWRNLRDWRNILSIAVVVLTFPLLPAVFGFLRLTRLVRLSRLARVAAIAARGLSGTVGRQGVVYVAALCFVAVVIGGVLMATLDPATVGSDQPLDGIWWAFVTLMSVGTSSQGDDSLETRMITTILLLCGVAFVSTLAASIAAYFIGGGSKLDEVDLVDLQAKVEEIHAMLSDSQSGRE